MDSSDETSATHPLDGLSQASFDNDLSGAQKDRRAELHSFGETVTTPLGMSVSFDSMNVEQTKEPFQAHGAFEEERAILRKEEKVPQELFVYSKPAGQAGQTEEAKEQEEEIEEKEAAPAKQMQEEINIDEMHQMHGNDRIHFYQPSFDSSAPLTVVWETIEQKMNRSNCILLRESTEKVYASIFNNGTTTTFSIHCSPKTNSTTKTEYVHVEFCFISGNEKVFNRWVDMTRSDSFEINVQRKRFGLSGWRWHTPEDEHEDSSICSICNSLDCIPSQDDAKELLLDVFEITNENPEIYFPSLDHLLQTCDCPKVLNSYMNRFPEFMHGILNKLLHQSATFSMKKYGLSFLLKLAQTHEYRPLFQQSHSQEKKSQNLLELIENMSSALMKEKSHMDTIPADVLLTDKMFKEVLHYMRE